MGYEIKALCPELAETFTDYMENLDFGHEPEWATCFCRFYHTDCSQEKWKNRTGDENRFEVIKEIKSGNMKGYLAFDGTKCIGWCNANNVQQFIRLEDDLKHIVKGQKVGCVICFVIHPEYRNQGVARQLLRKAVDDFRIQKFDAVLAIPTERKGSRERLYRGTLNMYKELAFEEIEKDDNASIMLLKFRP
ncbi:GNAT family N-acetyltransferase [Sedimentibacter sp.]|uniref:GNAT family N-acetyltransferase n=1 Tax=Sedimentibacter sp. TaxID=1960295 RepID=UPI000ED837D1|nr:GNAT family N-acetyltransferase [Sedimentibacter sp.]HCX61074.1 GNAT family N-acetyltransferase [Clostridiales bacterium]